MKFCVRAKLDIHEGGLRLDIDLVKEPGFRRGSTTLDSVLVFEHDKLKR